MGELLEKADAAQRAGRIDEAVELLTQARRSSPDDPAIPKRLAGLFREKGDRKGRIDALLDAAEAHGRSAQALKGIATAKLARSLDKTYARAEQVLRALQGHTESPSSTPLPVPELADSQPLAVIPLVRKARVASSTGRVTLSSPPVKVDDLVLDAPKTIPLFSALPPDAYDRLVDRCELVEHDRDVQLFHRGDPSDAIFVIVEGSVQVSVDQTPVATLGEGDFFGEIGVLTGKTRGADVFTSRPTQLMRIGFDVITELVQNHPDVIGVLLTFLRRRLADNILRRSHLFSHFSDEERRGLREKFRLVDVDGQTTLIQQGQVSGSLYVLLDGALDVVFHDAGQEKWMAQLTPGQVCGEISLITQLPAVAEVRAPEKCLVLELEADGFSALVATHPRVLAEATHLAGERMEALAKEKQPHKPELIVLT